MKYVVYFILGCNAAAGLSVGYVYFFKKQYWPALKELLLTIVRN